jgi:hypothetical protein
MALIRLASVSTANGVVSTCIPGFQVAVAEHRILRVTGDEQYFHPVMTPELEFAPFRGPELA